MSLVESVSEVHGIIENEIDSGPTPVFKLRSTALELPDPIARSQWLIRERTKRNVGPEEFLDCCESVEDLMLFNCLYGNMADNQRNQGLAKLADLLFRKQQEVLKQHNIQQAQEEKRKKNALAAMKAMKGLWSEDASKKTPKPPLPKEDDGE